MAHCVDGRRNHPALLFALALTLCGARACYALERPRVEATRAIATLRIDGRLDEPDWARAAPIQHFRLIFVREGDAPSDSTEVRVLFDERALYFGIRCQAQGPGRLRASLAPRDQILDDDFIAIHLDTYRDFHRAYVFGVNPYAVQLDGILDGGDMDTNWDGVWDAETTRDPGGWTAEIAVPLRTLRFPVNGPGVWGLWVRRAITRGDEICSWPLWRQAEQGDIMLQAADLTGLSGLAGGNFLEVAPYAATTRSAARARSATSGSLAPWSSSEGFQGGLDLRYPITSTLVANATVNPDYGQIEADALQIDVNQRYPLYYPEKRPFFLEGAETFAAPLDLVYTRRVANPAYGAKLFGKLGRWRLGAIGARDDGGGSADGVGARSDIGERSSVGVLGIAHATDALNFEGAVPACVCPVVIENGGWNLVAASDAKLRLGPSLFFTGQLAFSASRADSTDYNSLYSPDRAVFSDLAYDAELRYADGRHEAMLTEQYLGPDFRAETGFIEKVDRRETRLEANMILRPENAWLRSWQPIARGFVRHDHAGGLEEWYVSPMIDWKFQNQTNAHTMYERFSERWLGRFYDQNRYIFNVDNSLRRAIAVEFDGEVGEGIFYGDTGADSYLGWIEEYVASATVRPAPRFTAELSVTRDRFSREPWRAQVYDVWLEGLKMTWQFTRRLYARAYPQYDSDRRHLDADGLLGYVVHPGTVFFAGMDNGLDRIEGRHQATTRTVFLKASYRFLMR